MWMSLKTSCAQSETLLSPSAGSLIKIILYSSAQFKKSVQRTLDPSGTDHFPQNLNGDRADTFHLRVVKDSVNSKMLICYGNPHVSREGVYLQTVYIHFKLIIMIIVCIFSASII